jgi:small conductance mechanosensitive channel
MNEDASFLERATNWIAGLARTEIYDGRSLADLLTLEALVGLFGNLMAAIAIIMLGFLIAGWAARRLRRLSARHARLDDTLFNFLANIVR